MRVLVLNGSPRGDNSNTMILTKRFVKGLNSISDNSVKFIDINKKKIDHCLGCFACWKKHPYRCVVNDDVSSILKIFVNADLIVWSFPLYHYGMPSKMKAFFDRTLPTEALYSNVRKGNFYGILNDDTKHVIISTCGDVNENSYLSVDAMFKLSYGEKNLEKIYFMGGEALNYFKDSELGTNYLENVEIAGKEYSKYGEFSDSTREFFKKGILNREMLSLEQWFDECD